MLKISQTWLRCRNVYLWDKIWVGIRIWKYKCAEVCSGFETGHEIPKFDQSQPFTLIEHLLKQGSKDLFHINIKK